MSIKNFILKLAVPIKDELVAKSLAKVRKTDGKDKERPERDSDLYWSIYKTDPLAGAGIDYTIDFVVGAGFTVKLYDDDGNEQIIPEFQKIIRQSEPRRIIGEFLKDGLVEGDGYLYLMSSANDKDYIAGFDVIPARQVTIIRDEFNNIYEYIQELGESESSYPRFEPGRVAHYRNRPISGEAFGRSDIEPITEASEILRDMMIDLSNFISTKAYPPILWKLGSEDNPWGRELVEDWCSEREEIEPGDQIAVQGDVTYESVGVRGETLDVKPYLMFFASMVVSGLRIPAALTSIVGDMGQFTADSQSNAYARRINDIRQQLSELLEVSLFDRILRANGWGQYHSVVTWNKHDDESERIAVNNIIQLVNSKVLSREEARVSLNYPQEVKGTLISGQVDAPENADPAIQPESFNNKMNETKDDDARTGSKRENFEVSD
jgi:hypothetical protein